MSFVILHGGLKGYIEKSDGMNIAHADPSRASRFATREEARDARPGHHLDMGGADFSGTVLPYETARRNYEWSQQFRPRYTG